ncbi:hypothetical protein [Selenomonas ruminantium]|uniref:Uncharacterized protein n=1 Tax=Selenomonas ruminantium TaxID=971 RepID=A0A1H0UFE6_SELRU|nr:hypothetical protein [Selenomonas ruminantium]SDP64843.1 hypothetical protein SAMN05216366_13211 [Selenomonas ruminantium]
MLDISNIRKEQHGEWTRLVVDVAFSGVEVPYAEKTMYFAVKNEHADMLTDEVYDAFLLVPLYLAMYHHTDLHIHGKVSKKLYKNIMWYVRQILCDFSDDLSMVDVKVDGFGTVTGKGDIIGTGISCGVDSLCTIYDHFVKEDDPEYRINSLFLFNCGTHGDFENPASHKLYEARYWQNKRAADEMGLPVYQVQANLHAFTHKIGEQKLGYFAIYSCMFSLQKAISLYYTSSCASYKQILQFHEEMHDFDMAEYAESYLVPLLQTEHTRLIIDGCQYRRSQKILNIADWDVAQKHLNVCVNSTDGTNCCVCSKCMRTLVPLESAGKLEKFAGVFDIAKFKKHAYRAKLKMVGDYHTDFYANDNVDFARSHGMSMPNQLLAKAFVHAGGASVFIKKKMRMILGEAVYEKVKHAVRG